MDDEYFAKIQKDIRRIQPINDNSFEPTQTLLGVNDKNKLENAHEVRKSQMKEGDVAQILLGNFPGWENLGRGHPSKLDCRKLDNSAIVELKNKYNTCNAGGKTQVLQNLAKYKKENPQTTCILGIVNSKSIHDVKIKEHVINGVVVYEVHNILKLVFNENFESIITFARNIMYS